MYTTSNTGNVNITVEDRISERSDGESYRSESCHWAPDIPHSVNANRFVTNDKPHTSVTVHAWQDNARTTNVNIFTDFSGSGATVALSFDTRTEDGVNMSTHIHLPTDALYMLRDALAEHALNPITVEADGPDALRHVEDDDPHPGHEGDAAGDDGWHPDDLDENEVPPHQA